MLATYSESRKNNFDVLRLVAAMAVLVSHSWVLCGHVEPVFAGDTFGGLGVTVFFAISGFLVARSWHLDARPVAFAVKRVLRLWPGLVAVLLLSAYVLGPAVTTLSLDDYFSTHVSSYVVSNVALQTTYTLPGVFHSNPFPDAVNGSLWTLPIEVKAYLLILVLGFTRLLSRAWVVALVFALLVWVLVMPRADRPRIVAHWLEGPIQTRFVIVFVGAALLYALRDRIPLKGLIALVAAAAAWFTHSAGSGVHAAVWGLTIPYLVVFVAYRTPAALRKLTRPGDVSYGIYVWAFPVQQTIVHLLGGSAAPVGLLALSAPVTYGIALGSWRLVEAPALRLKQRLPVRAAARPSAGVA